MDGISLYPEETTYLWPYTVCLTGILGDWYDMRSLSKLARQQSWALQSRKAQQQIAPGGGHALWVWNRTDSQKGIVPAIDLQNDYNFLVCLLALVAWLRL
jgi:hypothetical protein